MGWHAYACPQSAEETLTSNPASFADFDGIPFSSGGVCRAWKIGTVMVNIAFCDYCGQDQNDISVTFNIINTKTNKFYDNYSLWCVNVSSIVMICDKH